MKSSTTVDVLLMTAFTFPSLMSLCISHRGKSWQSDKPRASEWRSIGAAVSAKLCQLIFGRSYFQEFPVGIGWRKGDGFRVPDHFLGFCCWMMIRHEWEER